MDIKHRLSGTRGLFYIEDEGTEKAAKLVYAVTQDGKMIVEHTEVDEALRGQNIGFELVQAAVLHARKYEMLIIPVCPFAKAVMDKRPDFKDVLALN